MSLFITWLVLPLVLGLASLGCGLVVERIAGVRLPGLLLMPLGLAAMVVVTQLATNWGGTARLATPAVIVLALSGYGVARGRAAALKPDWWAAGVMLGVFAIFAAPVVLSGQATFTGYNLNGEPSIHFIGIDRLMNHGRSVAGLPPSSYEFCLQSFFGNGYPSGVQTALGSVKPLVGQDVAWVYQPFIVFLVAMACLGLYAIVTPLVRRPAHRALVVFMAAQPALMYAYSLQGSVKELATVWIVTLLVTLVVEFVKEPGRLRSVVPLAVASAASIGVINVAIAPWLGLVLLAALVLALRARPRSQWRLTAKQAGVFVVLTGVLAYAPLSVADSLYNAASGQLTAQHDLTSASGLGNLLQPLSKAQVLGIWLSGDYRIRPTGTHHDVTYILIGVALASGLIGIAWTIRRRALAPLLYMAVSVVAGAYVVKRGSPWADGKAMMITSPAVLLSIMLGPAFLLERRRNAAAVILAGAVATGVLWSNALAYHDVNLAPKTRLLALESVGDRIAGQGPTVYFEFEEYGKHFLRRGDPDGRSEGCQGRYLPLRNGRFPRQGFISDPDDQTLRYLLYFRTIVLRRSPAISRPPSPYRLTDANRYYEVWQRAANPALSVVEHLALGNLISPSAVPQCRLVRHLAARARRVGGRIAYVERPPPAVVIPANAAHPASWATDPEERHVLITDGPGRIRDSVTLAATGRYVLWLGGSFGRPFTVSVDGRRVGEVGYALNGRDQYERVADLTLRAGRHEITLLRGGGSLRPGNGGAIRALGPVIFEPSVAGVRAVRFLEPDRADALCGRYLDWIEIVRRV